MGHITPSAVEKGQFWLTVAFLLIVADALIAYELKVLFRPLPILSIVPLFVLGYFCTNPVAMNLLRPKEIFFLVLAFTGYSIGIVTADGVTLLRLLEAAGAISAWLVGFWLFRSRKLTHRFFLIVLIITFVHSLVCIIAIADIAPRLFPTYDQIWSLNGTLIRRPSVTTDQNFQIFYFLPAVGMVLVVKRNLISIGALLTSLIAFLVLCLIQTRSGILILIGSFISGLALIILGKNTPRFKAIVLVASGMAGVSFVIINEHDAILSALLRFTQTDYATAYGRLDGFVYFFQKVINPVWWIPQGNLEYIKRVGNAPHSNITAQLMDGGLFAVISWLVLVAIPSIILYFKLIGKSLNESVSFVAIVALGMLVSQMTLNVPLNDQVWLWGGAAYATLLNTRS